MSRIGQKSIEIPKGITVEINGNDVTVKGAKGELSLSLHNAVALEMENEIITVKKRHNAQIAQSMWGTTARLISNY